MRSANLPDINDFLVRGPKKRSMTLVWVFLPRGDQDFISQKVNNMLQFFEFVPIDLNEAQPVLENAIADNAAVVSETLKEIKNILGSYVKPGSISEISRLTELRLLFKREEDFCHNLLQLEEKDGICTLRIWIPSSFI